MKRIARACCATSALLLAAFVAAAPVVDAPPPAAHLVRAERFADPGAGWDAPPRPPAAAGAPATVALPHAQPRAVASGSDSVSAPPEVSWLRLDIPEALRAPGHAPLFFYLPRWQTIGTVAVYFDDRPAWRSGGSRVWNGFNRPLWLPLSVAPGDPVPQAVWIRMASQQGVGGAVSSAWVGTQAQLLWRWRLRSWLQTDLVALTAGAYLMFGLFSLAVGLVRRREAIYFVFFAASVTHGLRSLAFLTGDTPPLLPDDWFGWVAANSLAWASVCVFAFAFQVHRQPMPRLARAIVFIVALISAATLPAASLTPHLSAILPAVYLLTGLLTLLIATSGLWASWKRRSREGLALFAFFALNLPVGLYDLALQNYRIDIENIYLVPHLGIGLFVVFLVIVWRRYVGAIAAVEAANAGLEARLAARERELVASHEQLRALEREQTLAAERQRLMQDMHDGIGSSLMSALRMVEAGRASPGETAQALKDCIDDLKLAIDSLDPVDADLLPLLGAVRFRLAPRLKAAGIALAWSVQDLPALPWLDPQSALHVLRIVQEVLTNILKHSGATAIDVATAHAGHEVLVRIRDNGRAFLPGEGTGSGKGLANVRSRVQALGGQCEWRAWEEGGEFRLMLPRARATE